jgi:hypothetical protein
MAITPEQFLEKKPVSLPVKSESHGSEPEYRELVRDPWWDNEGRKHWLWKMNAILPSSLDGRRPEVRLNNRFEKVVVPQDEQRLIQVEYREIMSEPGKPCGTEMVPCSIKDLGPAIKNNHHE